MIQATGAVEPAPALEATAGTRVLMFEEAASLRDTKDVVVLGSGARAVDTVIYLLKQGNAVNIVTPDPMELFEKGHSVNVQGFIRNAITSAGVRIWPGATDLELGDGTLTFTDAADPFNIAEAILAGNLAARTI